MDQYNPDKKYESIKITPRPKGETVPQKAPEESRPLPLEDGLFYVVDYDLSEIEGVGKFALKPQKIEPPKRDEIRELFNSMRDIARANRTLYFGSNRIYDMRLRRENAKILYEQGRFMKDFTDNYENVAGLKEYFPCYQMMGYEQLRTYFTWRTRVREGTVEKTSLAYAFLYIYELLNNIGVENPQDGLEKLLNFWQAYKAHDETINKYVIKWLKDYHVYYQLPHSFKEFIQENGLSEHYPKVVDNVDNFDLFCSISKYDIRKSAFFTEDKKELITGCFYFVVDKLRRVFEESGLSFEDSVFQPKNKKSDWQPFTGSLFYPWLKQPNRRVLLAENELYICSQNHWTYHTAIAAEEGKLLVGYVMKQMESVLRRLMKYKYKLTANLGAVTNKSVKKLAREGLSLERIVNGACVEFYREATKTVVSVDKLSLSKIRREALETQERLIVEEQNELPLSVPETEEKAIEEAPSSSSPWETFKSALNEAEKQAVSLIASGQGDLRSAANASGIMPEVLADGINEKAMDFIGDNILDDELEIYEDYIEQIKSIL